MWWPCGAPHIAIYHRGSTLALGVGLKEKERKEPPVPLPISWHPLPCLLPHFSHLLPSIPRDQEMASNTSLERKRRKKLLIPLPISWHPSPCLLPCFDLLFPSIPRDQEITILPPMWNPIALEPKHKTWIIPFPRYPAEAGPHNFSLVPIQIDKALEIIATTYGHLFGQRWNWRNLVSLQ